jgi:hypothetical protein
VFELDPKIWKLVGATLVLFASLAFAAWLVLRIRSRYRDNEDPAAVEHQMLMQLRDLRRQGDLSEDEYRSIKGRLIERLDGLSESGGQNVVEPSDRQTLPKS